MSMRAQVSLQFDDTELFENFVTPYKESRLLNSLIIKLLSKYYYDEEFRCLAEGTSLNSAVDNETVQSTQDIINAIRNSLIMQCYLVEDTSDTPTILNKTNGVARQTGVAKTTSTESGTNVLKDISGSKDKSENIDLIVPTSSSNQQNTESIKNVDDFIDSIKDFLSGFALLQDQLTELANQNKSLQEQLDEANISLEQLRNKEEEKQPFRKSYGAFDGAVCVSNVQFEQVQDNLNALENIFNIFLVSINKLIKNSV